MHDDAACTMQFAYAIGGKELHSTEPLAFSTPTKTQCVTRKTTDTDTSPFTTPEKTPNSQNTIGTSPITTPDTMNSRSTARETTPHHPTSSCKDQILSPMIRHHSKNDDPLSLEEEKLTTQLVRRKLKTSDDEKNTFVLNGWTEINFH